MLLLRRLVTVAGVLTLLASAAAAQAVSELQVSPENLTLRVGERKSLFPAAFDRSGNVIPTARFTYRSTAPAIASVDADGAVVGRAAGNTNVEVRAGTRSVTVPVTVAGSAVGVGGGGAPGMGGTLPAAPANTNRIIIDPATIYLVPSESQRLLAKAIAADGSVLGPVSVLWRSLTPGSISVDSVSGNVVGLAAGMGTIEARLPSGLSATAPAQVNAVAFEMQRKAIGLSPDEIDTVRVVVPAQNGRRLEAGLTFTSTNPNVVQQDRIGHHGVIVDVSTGRQNAALDVTTAHDHPFAQQTRYGRTRGPRMTLNKLGGRK